MDDQIKYADYYFALARSQVHYLRYPCHMWALSAGHSCRHLPGFSFDLTLLLLLLFTFAFFILFFIFFNLA